MEMVRSIVVLFRKMFEVSVWTIQTNVGELHRIESCNVLPIQPFGFDCSAPLSRRET
jgi:hypothetical protein